MWRHNVCALANLRIGAVSLAVGLGVFVDRACVGASSADACITADWRTRHPEWIWCDDFEADSPLEDRYFEYDSDGGDFLPVDGVGLDGSRGMRVRFQAGEVGAGSLKKSFGRTPSSYLGRHAEQSGRDFDEVYWQIWIRRQAGWQGGGGAKLTRATVMASDQWAQGMIAHLWSGGPGDAYLGMDPASGVSPSGTLVSTKYNDFDHLRWLGFKRGPLPLFDAEHAGEWFCVEGHVKLNTPGRSDGVLEFWINDMLQAGTYDLNWHGSWNEDPSTYKINAIFFENYWNAGSPVTQERYFDNLIISTQRIGCSCPSRDSDQDGIPDDVESRSGVFQIGVDDRFADSDQDGQSNADEYRSGTDPRDPRSRLSISGIRLTDDELTVWFDSAAGKDYLLEQTEHPAERLWAPIPELILKGDGQESRFSLIRSSADSGFYRLRLIPPVP